MGIINKLDRYNGCILADSVGLGKTFTAISVIKYYELRNKSVLVLCPKKLYQNWSTYRNNYKNNPLHSDRLRYDVLYHTDLSRVSGENNGIDLGKINWGNYDLVVIDESHNFRNGGKISTDADDLNPRKNRYLRLLDDVIRSGVKTKVLMLSATPVNNGFNDLKNQLELAYEGNVEAFDKLLNTERSINDIFRQAQFEYNRWSKLPEAERTTEALLQSLSFDFFEVLDSVTIARSRRHIEQYYDTTEIGSFPERLPVLSHRTQLTLDTDLIDYNQIYTLLSDLNLAIYTPSDFILKSRMDKYLTVDDEGNVSGLSRSGRELGIRRLMCINMLKRLESSIYSFRLTVKRLVALLSATLTKIEQVEDGEAIGVGQYDFNEGFDIDDLNDELLIGGGKTTIDLRDMDYLGWKNHLLTDLQLLQTLLHKVAQITPDKDAKLQHLLSDIEQKIAQPINAGNKKVIVFTAFSDTAEYLYDALSQILYDRHGLHSVLITGGIDACSTMKLPQRNKMTFDTALTLFSPRSKDKDTLLPNVSGEIDILIATDCISEGQNLQDCDYLINYDIHWNPVRIIQRFGRIDRIGSHNSCIQMVNYWPNIQLDEYINLKARVENRMKVSVMTSTGDDNLLSNDEQGDLEYRHKQLERLQTEVVDLEEMNTGISILDLGLNEFRLDLLDYIKRHGDLEQTPFGLHAVVPSSEKMPPGVIYILKNNNQGVNIDRKNQLHPFYMVYLTREGDVHCDHLSVLAEDGVIFISIDDNEVHNLRKICDEVFGERNFVADFIRKTKSTTNDAKTGVNYQHEFLLCYAKNLEKIDRLSGGIKDTTKYTKPDNDPNGRWVSDNPSAKSGNFQNGYFPVINPHTDKEDYPPEGRFWLFSKNTMQKHIDDGRICFKKEHKPDERGFIYKRYLKDLKTLDSTLDSLGFTDNKYMNQVATKELKEMELVEYFSYPKGVDFMRDIISSCTKDNDIILDFFSGSATTAHAVMQLNAEDLKDGKEGKRKYICVQLAETTPEDSEARKAGYATIPDIAKERIRRAGKKIVAENPEVAERLDTGFRAFKLDSSNYEEVSKTPDEYVQTQIEQFLNNIKTDRNDLDLLFGAMLSWGVPLSLSQPLQTQVVDRCTIYNVTDGELVACFAEEVSEAVVQAMAALQPERVLFRDSCFAEDKMKINLFELFKQALDWDEKEALDHIRVI